MDLKGPGTSLFQGNELNSFDNLDQREEEEEALEEQRRRDLELRNELEYAFDDVSFDNDEESLCNGSENRSSSAQSGRQNNLHSEIEASFLKGNAQNQCLNNNSSSCRTDGFNTPSKPSIRNTQEQKENEFSNEYGNFSDECRKKIQNGTLHDLVDQSGGGSQNIQTLLHYNHCFQRNSIGDAVCNGMPSSSNNNSKNSNNSNNNNNSNNSNNNNNNILKAKYSEKAEDSNEQLKILYDVRVREVHRLTEFIDSMRNEHKIEVGDLKHQLALLLSEKERASISHSQLQNLLVDCRQQVEQLVNDVNTLEKAKMELEASKQELMIQFDSAKLVIDDLQRKVLVLEKGSRNKVEAEQFEINIKSLSEKHSLELMNMKKELDNYKRNSEALLKENEDLKLKIINMSQINDESLAKKNEIISKLSQQIEETQTQFENLMKLSINEGNFRLQAELKLLKEEKSQLTLKIQNLEADKLKHEEELRQYESLSTMFSFSKDYSNNFEVIKDFEGSEISGKLGSELFRALNSQKAKRLEIKNLEAQLGEKTEQISSMKENEKILATEITSLKEEIQKYLSNLQEKENCISQKEEESLKLQNQVQELEEKLKISENELQNKCRPLEEETKLLKNRIFTLEKEKEDIMKNYSKEYMRFHNAELEKLREETEKHLKLEMLKKDVENETLKKEIDKLKDLYVEVCNAKENKASQLEKEKNNSSGMVDMEEVKRLQKELEKSRHRILEMDQTLKQQYEQEVEILNLDINQLILQLEKLKKEKDREVAEKDKVSVENELLKTEIEQVISEKNLLFLDYEKLLKEAEELRLNADKIKENSKNEMKKITDRHFLEMQNMSNKYEITVKKLKKEIELAATKAVKYESKTTSPMKNLSWTRNAVTQDFFSALADKSTFPVDNPEIRSSPVAAEPTSKQLRDTSVLTDPEPGKIPKKDVVKMMEKLGAHHEEEILTLEKKHCADLLKLEKKFHQELDKAKELIRRELQREHQLELEQLEEKHRIEMMNRIEQEKKEAIVDLITEWACEVQSLKVSYAESQAEMEKMKMKYKAAKSVAFQYKTYFKSKAEHMKEEWKRIEDGYERALRELEKNVHILVDVKEDEVKAKVDSITKLYEEKINRMKKKLYKFEEKQKADKDSGSKLRGNSVQNEKMELERLAVPDGSLCKNLHLLNEEAYGWTKWISGAGEPGPLLKKKLESNLKIQKSKQQERPGMQNNREKTTS